ncbi:MAG TPA: Rab family GTPase [Thermoplasmata archaeon]|jgi:small GTP-binding protein|nr:Rab family GTPase [Thermoplasmata archaeon]
MAVKTKVVLLGDSAVGKTSLIRRFVLDAFEDAYIATIGGKVSRKNLKVEGPNGTVDLSFMIWDLIGREGYVGFHAGTFAGTKGAILVADVTRRETLESLERYWIPLLFKVVGPIPLVFAGNKADLDGHAFRAEDLAAIANRHAAGARRSLPSHLETAYATSAKSGENVERVFASLGHLVVAGAAPDPVKEIYEAVVATGLRRSSDLRTPVGVLDAIIVDFCDGFEDPKTAMVILRQEVARAGLNINDPTREGIRRVVEYLAEAETEFRDEGAVSESRKRRRTWAEGLSG